MIALNFSSKRNWTYGDSNLYGISASPISNRWSSLIASEKNGLDYNIGVSGQSLTSSSNTFDKTTIDIFDSSNCKYIWFTHGTNDLPLSVTVANFKAKLLEVVDYANASKGWAYSVMVLPTVNIRLDVDYGQRLLDFNEAIRQIALLRGCIFIDTFTPFNSLASKPTYFNADNIHLNNTGHRKYADILKSSDYTPYTTPTNSVIYGYKATMI